MRRSSSLPLPAVQSAQHPRRDWQTIRQLLPYLLAWKGRVAFALTCLIAAKLANVAVPMVFKQLIDLLAVSPGQQILLVPLG